MCIAHGDGVGDAACFFFDHPEPALKPHVNDMRTCMFFVLLATQVLRYSEAHAIGGCHKGDSLVLSPDPR